LAKVTGKKVVYWRPATPIAVDTHVEKDKADAAPPTLAKLAPGTLAQMEALRDGQLHISAFGTGAVPGAVNTAGFIPLFCPAPADGPFGYEMEIIVPASSSIQHPEDLRGRTIALVSMSSNSGGRAGMVYLKESTRLVPGRDYKYVFTGSHAASIRAVAEGAVDAACVANDLLLAELERGAVKAEQIRSIYKSPAFPPLCFGIGHDLNPELAAKIREAFKTFSALPEIYRNAPRRARFSAVDYQKDWAYVREVDGKLKTVVEVN
jgi:phosphonate transport system substrate-binding protein